MEWLGSRVVSVLGLRRRSAWVQIAAATLSGNSQARSQKLNKEQTTPPLPCAPLSFIPLSFPPISLFLSLRFPPFSLRSWTPPRPRLRLGSLEDCSSSPAGPIGARPLNAFGLSKTHLATTSLVLLCGRVTCSITGHITRRQLLPPRAST